MKPESSRASRVVGAGAIVLVLALLGLAVAVWGLLALERARAKESADDTVEEAVADVLNALAREDVPVEWFVVDRSFGLLRPAAPRPFDTLPAPDDPEAMFFVLLARRGGVESSSEITTPRGALRIAMRSEDASVRLLAAVEGERLEVREGTGGEGVWYRDAHIPPALSETREAVLAGLLVGAGPVFEQALERALLAVGSEDDEHAAGVLVGSRGPAILEVVRRRRAELSRARELAARLVALRGANNVLRGVDDDAHRIVLEPDGSAAIARRAPPSRPSTETPLPPPRGWHWFVGRLPAEQARLSAHLALRSRGGRLLGPAEVDGPDTSTAALPGTSGLRVAIPHAGGALTWPLVLGFFIAAAAAIAAFAVFARGVVSAARLAAMRTEFVATVGHELRTPVAVIRTCAETLALGRVSDEEKRRGFVEAIVRESERLSGLLGNVLDFARMEAGRRTFRLDEGDLGDVVRDTVTRYRGALERLGFEVELDVEEPLPAVRCDREALGAALTNLLENAAKYSPERRDAVVRVRRDGPEIAVEVVDHGVGVPDDEKARVFERFVRGAGPSVKETRGTGIGLALVRHAVVAHGGRVEVADTPGGGATFRMLLPIVRETS